MSRMKELLAPCVRRTLNLPFYLAPVSAGFPSPADDYLDVALDLNDHVVRNPAATFFMRASGESMLGAGIHSGDILVVDRSLEPVQGRVVIAAVNGELTVKRLRRTGQNIRLVAENPAYPVIEPDSESQVDIWGVVTYVIHKV